MAEKEHVSSGRKSRPIFGHLVRSKKSFARENEYREANRTLRYGRWHVPREGPFFPSSAVDNGFRNMDAKKKTRKEIDAISRSNKKKKPRGPWGNRPHFQ